MTDAVAPRPHRAALVLVLGILGLLCCMPAGIVAWVLGYQDRKAMQAGTMDRSGESTVRAGEILGMIATLWYLLGALIFVVILATGLAPRLYEMF